MISPLGFEDEQQQAAMQEDELLGMEFTTNEAGTGTVASADDINSVSTGAGVVSVTTHESLPSNNKDAAAAPLLTGRLPLRIYLTCDDQAFSPYQVLVRQQIEFFETLPVDLDVVQGRNKPIQLGQVGIRCMHCRSIYPISNRRRGAVYYPSTLQGLYQAAQNMAKHLHECDHVPLDIRNQLAIKSQDPVKSSGGKEAWAERAIALGVYQDEEGLRFEKSVASREHSGHPLPGQQHHTVHHHS